MKNITITMELVFTIPDKRLTINSLIQSIKDISDLNAHRTADRAGVAGRANPDRPAVENRFEVPGPKKGDNFPWRNIHGITNRTGT